MYYLISIVISGLAVMAFSGLLPAFILYMSDKPKKFSASPFLMAIAPLGILILVFILFSSGASGGEVISSPTLISWIFIDLLVPFLLSLTVVSLYEMSRYPYILVSTILTALAGVSVPFIATSLDSASIGYAANIFLMVLPFFGVFNGYLAYYANQ